MQPVMIQVLKDIDAVDILSHDSSTSTFNTAISCSCFLES